MIFTEEQWARLGAVAAVVSNDGVAPMDENTVDAALPRAMALLGQTDLRSARIVLVRVQDCRWPTPTDRHTQGILGQLAVRARDWEGVRTILMTTRRAA